MQKSHSGRALPPPSQQRGVLSELLFGSLGGLSAALLSHPLDTIKTRMQSGSGSSVSQVCRSILRTDGLTGFYRGITVPAFSQPLFVGSSFAGLQAGYQIWDRYKPLGVAGDEARGVSGSTEAALRLIFAGGLGGVACAFSVTPGERVKVVLQMQGQDGTPTKTPMQTVRAIVAEGGWRGLFVGLKATLIREVPGTILWFGAYEGVTAHMESAYSLSRPLAVFIGAIAGSLAYWAPNIPIDTIKTRQQTAPSGAANGFMDMAREIVKTRGFRGFWLGSAPLLARGVTLDITQLSGADLLRRRYADASMQRQQSSMHRSSSGPSGFVM